LDPEAIEMGICAAMHQAGGKAIGRLLQCKARPVVPMALVLVTVSIVPSPL